MDTASDPTQAVFSLKAVLDRPFLSRALRGEPRMLQVDLVIYTYVLDPDGAPTEDLRFRGRVYSEAARKVTLSDYADAAVDPELAEQWMMTMRARLTEAMHRVYPMVATTVVA